MKRISIIIFYGPILFSCQPNRESQPSQDTEIQNSNTTEFTQIQYQAAGIELGKIEQKNLKEVVQASGYLEVPPQNEAMVAPVLGGIIREIDVLEGNYVKKGQSLARMEHPDFTRLQEDYITAIANLDFLQKEYERQKELYEQNVGAGKVFEQTSASLFAAKGKAASLENQLQMLDLPVKEIAAGNIVPSVTLRAPISGYVGHIKASIGVYAEPNNPLFDIVDNSKLHVDLLVYEKDLFKVKEGQTIQFTLTNQGNRQIEGRIFGIGKTFENETKALVVHAEILNEKHQNLIAGMYVNALINVGEERVQAVPQDAVVHSGGSEYIFIVVSNDHREEETVTFQMVAVNTGVENLGYVELKPMEEIQKDADVVIKGAFYVLSQLKGGGEDLE